MALSPQNSASPSSATSAMTWLLRSIDHSLSASEARKAWPAGIMAEPGSLAPRASALPSRRTRWWTKKNRRQHEVADIGEHLPTGADPLGALLVEPPRQGRKALLAENFPHRSGAQRCC